MNKLLHTSHGVFHMRPYRNEDEERVLVLWEAAFKKKATKAVWRWKFHDCPFGRQIMLACDEDDRPVTMFSGIPYPALLGKSEVVITHMMDNLADPSYRFPVLGRKSLFVETALHFYSVFSGRDTSFVKYGFPGTRHFELGRMFLHYEKLECGLSFMELKNPDLPYEPGPFSGRVEVCKELPGDFDTIWKKNKSSYPFTLKRDTRFVQWRYLDHPVKDYRLYLHRSFTGGLTAYAVLHMEESSAVILDLFARPSGKGIKYLVARMARDAREADKKTLKVWLPMKHFLTRILGKMGFMKKMDPHGMVPAFTHGSKNDEPLLDTDGFFFTMGDGDLY